MSYKLFLDDERNPKTTGWIVVRSVTEFKSVVKRLGVPAEISFDHDLGADVPDGYDAVKWMIAESIDLREIKINVHSANPVGRDNIEGIVKSYSKFLSAQNDLT